MSNFYTDVERVFADWNYGHPKVLYGLIRAMRPSVCVEVGTYRGLGAAWMAQALKENGHGKLYCIDNFSLTDHEPRHGDARKHLDANLTALGVREFVEILEGDSDWVQWPDRVDLGYVDGWHSYHAARHDFDQCAQRGAECICLDDVVQSVGPRLLMQEVRAAGKWDVTEILRDCGLAICMRRAEKGPITFSQELPGHLGVDLTAINKQEQLDHFCECASVNVVDYGPIIQFLHEGKR